VPQVILETLEAPAVQVTKVRRVSKVQQDNKDRQDLSGVLDLPGTPEHRAIRVPPVPLEALGPLARTEIRARLVRQDFKGHKEELDFQDLRVIWVRLDLWGLLEIQESRARTVQREVKVTQEALELQVHRDHRVLKVHLAPMEILVHLE